MVTTFALKMARAKDAEQLVVATQQNRVIITHNAGDFKLLHDAWRIWSQEWQIFTAHPGILIPKQMQPSAIAHYIDVFLSQVLPLPNELYFWKNQGGWTRYQ